MFAITPDLIRQPTAALQASARAPADVEVSVDGSTVYRTHVGPGPIALDNVLLQRRRATVQVIVTDATGRREVIEQPFLFTDSVLAKGLHEFSYFAGRRSRAGPRLSLALPRGGLRAFHRVRGHRLPDGSSGW